MLLLTHILFSMLLSVLFFNGDILFFSILIMASIIPDLDIYIPFIRHRGIFHSLTMGFLIGLILFPYSFSLCIAFFLGFCSHLFIDSLTVHGTSPFWPFSNKKVKIGAITTGSYFEKIFLYLIFLALAIRILTIVL